MKKLLIAILTLFIFTTTTHAQNSDFVQVVDIGAERFVDHLRRVSSEVEFTAPQKTQEDLESDPLHAWISIFESKDSNSDPNSESKDSRGSVIFFVNGNGYVSAIGLAGEGETLERVIDSSLTCVGLTDSEIDSLKNSTDSIKNVICASMRRKIFIDRQPNSILIFATEE